MEVAGMDEHRRDHEQREQRYQMSESSSPNERDNDQNDDLGRRRTQQRPSLTRREKEERWPIG
jgi:hypothetical protein